MVHEVVGDPIKARAKPFNEGSDLRGGTAPHPESIEFKQLSPKEVAKLSREKQLEYLEGALNTLDPQIVLAAIRRIPDDVRRTPGSPHLDPYLVPPICNLIHRLVARGFESSHQLLPMRGDADFFLKSLGENADHVADIIRSNRKEVQQDIDRALQLAANFGFGKRQGHSGEALGSSPRDIAFRQGFANTYPLVILRGDLVSVGKVASQLGGPDRRDSRIRQAYRFKVYSVLRDNPPQSAEALDLLLYPLRSDPALSLAPIHGAAEKMIEWARHELNSHGRIFQPSWDRFAGLVRRAHEAFFTDYRDFVDRELFKALVTTPITIGGESGYSERAKRKEMIKADVALGSDARKAIFDSQDFRDSLRQILSIEQSTSGIWKHHLRATLSTCCAYGMSSSEAKQRIAAEINSHPISLVKLGLKAQLTLLWPKT